MAKLPTKFNLMQSIKSYVSENSNLLFKHHNENERLAIFDKKGFFFTYQSQEEYNSIKDAPHLYVAWSSSVRSNIYIGKSFQQGGRWKRSHYYHLGALAHQIHGTSKIDEQNHSHWIKNWMDVESVALLDENKYSLELKELVYICFIPFQVYANQNHEIMTKQNIRAINTRAEKTLIEFYKDEDINLLNVTSTRK